MKPKPEQAADTVVRKPRRRALLIGIRYKDNAKYGTLPGTYDGVDEFWRLLVRKFGFCTAIAGVSSFNICVVDWGR